MVKSEIVPFATQLVQGSFQLDTVCLGLQGDGKKGNRPVKRRIVRKHKRKPKSGQGAAREAAHGSDDEVLLGQQHVLGDLSQVNLAKY